MRINFKMKTVKKMIAIIIMINKLMANKLIMNKAKVYH